MEFENPIPITVFTGFLGSGKTTIINNLISTLPKSYKIVILKNEFGNSETDSKLYKSNFKVKEIVNGCLCCVLVGQIKTALFEIKRDYNPDRIIVETSGSAFPAPISIQIRELGPTFSLDSIITVVDCVNFTGYEDKSYTAKLQAQYTDVILLNKHELVTEDQYEKCLDHVFDLNEDTPKVKVDFDQPLNKDLVFGLDTKLFLDEKLIPVDLIQINILGSSTRQPQLYSESKLSGFLKLLPKDEIYRVKGFIRLQDDGNLHILNFAFGRFMITPLVLVAATSDEVEGWEKVDVRVTVMGELSPHYVTKFREFFQAENDSQVTYIPKTI